MLILRYKSTKRISKAQKIRYIFLKTSVYCNNKEMISIN